MREIYEVYVQFWTGQVERYGTYAKRCQAEKIAEKIRKSHPLYKVKVESILVLNYEG